MASPHPSGRQQQSLRRYATFSKVGHGGKDCGYSYPWIAYLHFRMYKCARTMMPALEAFTAQRPAYYMHAIALRHCDGHWPGKRQPFGDTYPRYRGAINAATYHYYAKCTGGGAHQRRAENIARNNLCQSFEDGSASCAFVNPRMVDGQRAHRSDAFANDQDWASAFYLPVSHGT